MSSKKKSSRALQKIEPNYIERTAQVQKKAEAALIKQAVGLWKSLAKDRDELSKRSISIVNTASQLGGCLLQIVGGEQLGLSFWKSHCAEQLPFNLDAAQELISIHKKVPEPITEMSQIWPVWKQVNLAMGTLQIPERTEDQSPSNQSPLNAVTHAFQQGYILYQKWVAKEPLKEWDKSRLETMFAETKQAHDLHEEIAGLLPKKPAA